jgi:hypothetical protein
MEKAKKFYNCIVVPSRFVEKKRNIILKNEIKRKSKSFHIFIEQIST